MPGQMANVILGGMSRSEAKTLGDFIDPGEAGLIVSGEGKVEDTIRKAITRAEKQTVQELNGDLKDIDRTFQEAVKDRRPTAPSSSQQMGPRKPRGDSYDMEAVGRQRALAALTPKQPGTWSAGIRCRSRSWWRSW